jgi:enoyl-CoA hydratase/carnithine racemase
MSKFAGKTLSWELVDQRIEVHLHREPCNEIGTSTLVELERLAKWIREGCDGARALIFTSDLEAGFCAGADLRELYQGLQDRRSASVDHLKTLGGPLAQRLPEPAKNLAKRGLRSLGTPLIAREVRQFLDRIHAVFDTFDTAPLTTIAATHGVVFGGGFELALTCDLIVAEKTTRFCFPELRLGLIPGFGGVPRLKRDLGNAIVRDLLLTGRSLNARRAYEVGLVSQVVARGEGLNVARKVAEQAARFDAHTAAIAKAFIKPIPRAELEREKETFCRLITSPAVESALKTFVTSDDPRPYLP